MGGYKQIQPRFKKGESGNPKGRPKDLPELKEILSEILSEEKEIQGKKLTGLRAVLISLHAKAVKGDIRAIQEILDRFYGKPQQYIDHTTKGNEINSPRIIFANLNEDDEQ